MLTLALSNTMGFVITWKSKTRLQKHPPKGKAVLQHCGSCACLCRTITNAFPRGTGMPSLTTAWPVASGKELGLQDTCTLPSSQEGQGARMFL